MWKFLPREISITQLVSHPNIIRDGRTSGECRFLEATLSKLWKQSATALAENGDLPDYFNLRGHLPEEEARHIILHNVPCNIVHPFFRYRTSGYQVGECILQQTHGRQIRRWVVAEGQLIILYLIQIFCIRLYICPGAPEIVLSPQPCWFVECASCTTCFIILFYYYLTYRGVVLYTIAVGVCPLEMTTKSSMALQLPSYGRQSHIWR